jgi:lipopolysaccharide transport system permease protein
MEMTTSVGQDAGGTGWTPARVVRVGGSPATAADTARGPWAPFLFVWRRRQLLRRMVQRDVEQRFRGSVLGKIWAVVAPLFMLTLYTVAFGVLLRPQWQDSVSSPVEIALIYFSGLIVFDFFMECINRAPTLMLEHVGYIKKMVFPLEILAWVALGGALFRLAIGLVLLTLFYLAARGLPPITVVIIPVFLVLLGVVALGFIWLLSALSVFLRDIRHAIAVLMPSLMFLTPVFFPLASAPKVARHVLYANPLTFILEGIRGALFQGVWPNWIGLGAYAVIAVLFTWFSFWVFKRLRVGFADVL